MNHCGGIVRRGVLWSRWLALGSLVALALGSSSAGATGRKRGRAMGKTPAEWHVARRAHALRLG